VGGEGDFIYTERGSTRGRWRQSEEGKRPHYVKDFFRAKGPRAEANLLGSS